MNPGELLEAWKKWSVAADRSEDGWESDFPLWQSLMDAARGAMVQGDVDAATLAMIAECWSLSEEDEELLDFARDHLEECFPVLEALAKSSRPECRWQVYEALASAGPHAEGVIRAGLADPDRYARRRAMLALAHRKPSDAQQIAERLVNDEDPYVRLAAIEMIVASSNADFRRRALDALSGDSVDFVRHRAKTVLDAEPTQPTRS